MPSGTMGSGQQSGQEAPWLRHYPEEIDWGMPLEPAPAYAVFDRAVARYGERICTDFMGARLTYREIGALTDRFAKGLQSLGIGPGSRIGLFLPNSPYFVVAFFAALKTGATVVNYNPLYVAREIEHQILDSETEVMVTLDLAALYGKLRPLIGRGKLRTVIVCPMAGILPFPKNWLFRLLKRREIATVPRDAAHASFDRLTDNDGRFAPVPVTADDLAVLQYTGGTSGTPKGAMLSHGNLSINVAQSSAWFAGARPGEETMLAVLPFFHVFAMTVVMNLSLTVGATMLLHPRFELDKVMDSIQRSKVTLFPAVPTIYAAINNHPNLDRYDLSSLRLCLSGGAPLPLEVQRRFEALTGCSLVEGYGLTEASPVVSANPLFGLNKVGTIGLPLPGTEIRIVSLEDGETVLPQGEKGEVCVRGPQVMQGYLGKPDDTAQALREGWLHTGDVGYLDEDGYTVIVDRIKDVILCGGYNVYPRNVEEVIQQHPAVAEVVVAGLPDAYRGETVKAYIRVMGGQSLTERDLLTFLEDRLSPIERPRLIEFRDALPKTMIGKLSRKALLEEEAARRAGGTTDSGAVKSDI